MMIEMEFWQMILLLLAFFGGVAGAAKVFLTQVQRHMDERFTLVSERLSAIEQDNKKEAQQWQEVERKLSEQWQQTERDLMKFKADMPLNYVRREDFIRGQSVIENKIDTLAVKLENAQLRGHIPGGIQHGESV